MIFKQNPPLWLAVPACLGIGWLFCAPAAEAQTLREAVAQALQVNQRGFSAPSELATRKERLRIEKEFNRARSQLFPEVNLAMGRGREWSNTPTTRAGGEGELALDRDEMSLTLRQRLFDGFATRHELAQAEAELQANDFNKRWADQDLTFQVVRAYLDVLELRELLAMGNARLLRHQDHLEKRREMTALGIQAEVKTREAQNRLARIIPEHRDNLNRLQNAETQFTRLVGQPPSSLTRPPAPDGHLPASLETAIARVLASHPALLAARSDLEGVRAEIKSGQSAFWPKVNLALSLSNSDNVGGARGFNENATAMVQLEYNLFQGGQHLADLRLSKRKASLFQESLDQTRLDLRRLITDSWNAIEAARNRTLQLEQRVAISREVLAAYDDQFRLGLGAREIQDVWDAEDDLDQARRDLTAERFQMVRGVYRLLADMGTLKESMLQPVATPGGDTAAPAPDPGHDPPLLPTRVRFTPPPPQPADDLEPPTLFDLLDDPIDPPPPGPDARQPL